MNFLVHPAHLFVCHGPCVLPTHCTGLSHVAWCLYLCEVKQKDHGRIKTLPPPVHMQLTRGCVIHLVSGSERRTILFEERSTHQVLAILFAILKIPADFLHSGGKCSEVFLSSAQLSSALVFCDYCCFFCDYCCFFAIIGLYYALLISTRFSGCKYSYLALISIVLKCFHPFPSSYKGWKVISFHILSF